MDEFSSRVDLDQPLPIALNQIVTAYQLGKISSYYIIQTGYQELNIKLTTSMGTFIIKMFSREKSRTRIKDNITSYLEFAQSGIPVPQLRKKQSGYLYQVSGKNQPTYLCVMDYFDGKSFKDIPINSSDILMITGFIARIHNHTTPITLYYDTMGIANFLDEFVHIRTALDTKDASLIQPLVQHYRKIDYAGFRKCLIHGALERENILKNQQGDYCILDLGCLDYNCAIFDLATFLADFTIDFSPLQTQKICFEVTKKYQTFHKLSPEEKALIPFFISIQYAVYVARMSYGIKKLGDNTKQSLEWLDLGRRGLKKFINLKF